MDSKYWYIRIVIYNTDTIGNVRTDYLYRMQRVYEAEIGRMQDTIDNSKKIAERYHLQRSVRKNCRSS